MTKETVLITGASGFIGSHLASALVAAGAQVHAVGRSSRRFKAFAAVNGSVACHELPDDDDKLRSLFRDIAPASCYHLASYFVAEHRPEDIDQLVTSNILFPTTVADALAEVGGVTLVNVGTAWQHRDGRPYNPNNLYAATKQAFENVLYFYAERRHLDVVHLKLFDTYGPRDPRPKLMRLLLDARRNGSRLALSPGYQLIDLLHVSDVVEALQRARQAAAVEGPRRFAATSGQPVSLRRLVELVQEHTGGPLEVDWGATPYRGLEMFDPWDAGSLPPGWRPRTSLAAGIRQLWFEEGTTS